MTRRPFICVPWAAAAAVAVFVLPLAGCASAGLDHEAWLREVKGLGVDPQEVIDPVRYSEEMAAVARAVAGEGDLVVVNNHMVAVLREPGGVAVYDFAREGDRPVVGLRGPGAMELVGHCDRHNFLPAETVRHRPVLLRGRGDTPPRAEVLPTVGTVQQWKGRLLAL